MYCIEGRYLVEGLRSERVIARSAYATRRPAQRDVRHVISRRLGERGHPDIRQGVWGAAPLNRAVVTGDRRAGMAWLDVDRSHGAVWNWTHELSESQNDPPTAEPSRVAVDEKRIELHDLNDIEFLVDGMGSPT